MPRLIADASNLLEQLEGAQGLLGNALVYLDLVALRVRLAAEQQPDLMAPAVADLAQVKGLIRRGQAQIRAVGPVCARGGNQ